MKFPLGRIGLRVTTLRDYYAIFNVLTVRWGFRSPDARAIATHYEAVPSGMS